MRYWGSELVREQRWMMPAFDPMLDPTAAMERDAYWMRRALMLAGQAAAAGEVPVGAVIVRGGVAVAQAWNQPIGLHDPTAHAEILALRAAGQVLANYRLVDTTVYVTLEPCPMCVGALVHARVARLVYGASDPKTGAVGGVFALLSAPQHNHRVTVTAGVLAEACGDILRAFFHARRRDDE